MKYDPFGWVEITPNAETAFATGRVLARSSKVTAWFVTVEGVESLAGVGYDLDVRISAEGTVRAEVEEGARAFLYEPMPSTFEPSGPIFTNADRKPVESGAVLEVKKAVREFELMQRQARLEHAARMREAKAAARPRDAAQSQEPTTAEATQSPEGVAEGQSGSDGGGSVAEGGSDETPSA